jgi:hypothetical protein
MAPMAKEERDVQRKRKVLRHAEKTDHVARSCRYFGIGRSSPIRGEPCIGSEAVDPTIWVSREKIARIPVV